MSTTYERKELKAPVETEQQSSFVPDVNNYHRVPEGMTAEKLREVANWLDLYDEIVGHYLEVIAMNEDVDAMLAIETVRGTEVQDDLRRWATDLERTEHYLEAVRQLNEALDKWHESL